MILFQSWVAPKGPEKPVDVTDKKRKLAIIYNYAYTSVLNQIYLLNIFNILLNILLNNDIFTCSRRSVWTY